MDEDGTAVIRQAERIINQASWRILEETCLEALVGTSGLRWARLEPRSDVIHLVTYNGEHIGHIRRERSTRPGENWVAVMHLSGRTIGAYDSARDAAEAIAHACGIEIPKHL